MTIQLKDILDNTLEIKDKDREPIIEQINGLIEKRGKLMVKITPPFSENAQVLGKEVIKLNTYIEEKMGYLLGEIKQDMRQVNKQKESNRSYINPYRNLSPTDGMYHDSKE